MSDPIPSLLASLDQHANPKTRDWWEKYMKGVIPFRGVGIPEIKRLIAIWRKEQGIDLLPEPAQLEIALCLFEYPMAEDKLAGILFLQDYLYDRFDWNFLLDRYVTLYSRELIFDWNTCDWFCVRVLGPTIAGHGLACAAAINEWVDANNLWQARSSVVAFIPITADSQYHRLIYMGCGRLIQREERFAKTAVGWILHDLSRVDKADVRQFIEQHLKYFSVESLKNALKYFDAGERNQYVQRLKAQTASG